MTTSDFAQARELASLILPETGGRKPPILIQAVVHSYANGYASIFPGGFKQYPIANVRVLDTGYQPQAGHSVWVLKNGPDMLILSRLRAGNSSDVAARIAALEAAMPPATQGTIIHRGTSAAQHTGVTNATIIVTGSPNASFLPGRRYKATLTIFAANQSDTSSRFNIGLENAASTQYGEQWIARFLGQASTYTFVTTFTVPSSIGMAMRVRASRRDGTGSATFFTGPRNGWSSELIIEDKGPV